MNFSISPTVRWILLAGIPGLMFCILPVPGMPFRFSWQLAALWFGGVAFASFLTDGWLVAFWLIALFRTITLQPIAESYLMLLTVGVFLAGMEGFRRIDGAAILVFMRLAAVALLVWMGLQHLGWVRSWFDVPAGPFNPDAAGIFLAVCLPAFFAGGWWLAVPIVVLGITVTKVTTAFLAALAAIACFWFISAIQEPSNARRWAAALVTVVILASAAVVWFYRVDSLQNTTGNVRWTAWKHAVRAIQVEPLGRGLGSFEQIFPLLASGDRSLGDVRRDGNELVGRDVFAQAHNEYIQIAFELGLPCLAIVALWLLGTAIWAASGMISAHVAAGIAAVAVACFGFHVLHDAPLALLSIAWIGIFNREKEASK